MKPAAIVVAIVAPLCLTQCVASRVATKVGDKIDSLPATELTRPFPLTPALGIG